MMVRVLVALSAGLMGVVCARPAVADTWVDYNEIGPDLLAYEAAYPTLCERYDLGLSVNGLHLWALRISDNISLEEDEPEFKYISSMHGNEIVGAKMCMMLIDYLLTHYGSDPQATNIVNEVDLWIVPLMNPDGYTDSPRTRYNANGVDLNRDFPDFGDPNTTTGRAIETANIMNWSAQHAFVVSANFHGGALVVNYPYDNSDTGSQYTPDDDLFVYISEEYSSRNLPMWNGAWYHGITNGADWYFVYNGMQDWNYHFMGCNEVTIELSDAMQPSASLIGTFWNDNRDAMMAYIETSLIGVRGIVTHTTTGLPLAATVTVAGRNHEVYTDPDVGDYHRMLLPGTYDLTFTAAGLSHPVTVPNVAVLAGPATRLDIELGPAPPITQDVNAEAEALVTTPIALVGYDPNGDPIDFVITSLPAHGDLSDPNAGAILIVPHILAAGGNQVDYFADDYNGPDGFDFRANDGGTSPSGGDSNPSTVSITVIPNLTPDWVYRFPFDSDPGWSTLGGWAFGPPSGGSGDHGNPDPTAGHTGLNVYGYNLASPDGGYTNNLAEMPLTTSAIDCTGMTNVQLRFWRWLGVEQSQYDHAYVRVSNDLTNWTTLWENPNQTITETAWSQQQYDISAVADGQPAVYIRWTMGTTDGLWTFCGWNVDDVEIWATQDITCVTGLGDMDGDGDVDGDDIQQFTDCYVADDFGSAGCACGGGLTVADFVDSLLAGTTYP